MTRDVEREYERNVGHDPPARPDGLCACGCGRELPHIAVVHLDPFATVSCAREYHGFPLQAWNNGRGVRAERRRHLTANPTT